MASGIDRIAGKRGNVVASQLVEGRKQRPEDLAVLGGDPLCNEPLRVGRPNIGNRQAFMQRVERALDTRSLTNDGPFVHEFEERIADFLGVKHCVAVCNATIGLEIAIRSLGLEGDVIVPSFTFVATAHALKWQGLRPVFADVDLDRHTISPESAERMVGPRTTGIVGVHLWGRGCDVSGLEEVASRHGLALMFDAAHAFGASHRGKMIGGFGRAEVFSFHATKFLNSLEGGAIVTDDAEVAMSARRMRNFGIGGPDLVNADGTNGKMNEISAAMGLTSLEAFDELVRVNRENHVAYSIGLAAAGLQVAPYDTGEKANFQYVAAVVPAGGLTRDELAQVLEAENVLVRRYFYPGCHAMSPFASSPRDELPNTEELSKTVMCFPTGTAVDKSTIDDIATTVAIALANSDRVRSALTA